MIAPSARSLVSYTIESSPQSGHILAARSVVSSFILPPFLPTFRHVGITIFFSCVFPAFIVVAIQANFRAGCYGVAQSTIPVAAVALLVLGRPSTHYRRFSTIKAHKKDHPSIVFLADSTLSKCCRWTTRGDWILMDMTIATGHAFFAGSVLASRYMSPI